MSINEKWQHRVEGAVAGATAAVVTGAGAIALQDAGNLPEIPPGPQVAHKAPLHIGEPPAQMHILPEAAKPAPQSTFREPIVPKEKYPELKAALEKQVISAAQGYYYADGTAQNDDPALYRIEMDNANNGLLGVMKNTPLPIIKEVIANPPKGENDKVIPEATLAPHIKDAVGLMQQAVKLREQAAAQSR